MAVLDSLQTPRTLPHSEESERAVLAGILLEPQVLATVASRLVEGDFYFERHQRIYRAMIDLQTAGTEVDLRTLQARLEQQGHIDAVGGLAYLAGLDVDLPDLGRIDSYVEIVKERSLRRRLIQACSDVTRSALDGGLEANEALGKAEQAILGLGEEAVARGFVSLGRVLDKTMEDIEERPGSTLIGIPTGFTDLDRMTHGLNKGNLIIIAGRPGMGKCLSADAELVEADGTVRTIAEIFERQTARLATLNREQQFEWTSPSAFVDDGVKPVFEVTTRLGRRIKVTQTHPFLTLGGWKPLRELSVGDAVGVPRQLEVFGDEALGEHRARLLGYLLGDGGLTANAPRFTNGSPAIRDDFADAVARFGGLRLTSADSGGARTVTLTVVADESVTAAERERFAATLRTALAAGGKAAQAVAAAAGVSPASITGWRHGRYVPSVEGANALAQILPEVVVPDAARRNAPNALTRWLADLGLMGCGAYEKFVPRTVFRAPQRELGVFLNRLFAIDGWVSTFATGQVQVGYCTCSERLARQVQHLLLRFGVTAALRRRKVRYRGEERFAWQLEITERESVVAFLDRIGVFAKERAIRRARASMRRRRPNPNRDVLPAEVGSIIDRERGLTRWPELARRLGFGRGYDFHRGKRGVSRDRLRTIARALDSEPLEKLADSALYWDAITEIRYAGDERVYDLTIPDTHNFVANDICVHNTSLALNVAQFVAIHQNKPVGVFSLEMSEQELALRILCSEADVSFSRLRAGHLSQKQWQTIVQTVRRLSPAPLFIDDSPNPSLLEVASKTRRLRAELGLELIILDYLQLMQAGGRYENRNLEIAAISRSLKQLAKELEIPVIALSQLSRQPERRSGDHRPQLADLRESGCLTGDTLVTLADSGARVPMRELSGRSGFSVWALDPDSWTLQPGTVTRAFSTGMKQVFRLTTRLGRTIRATANHRFLTIEGWRRLDELTPGARLAMPRRLGSPVKQTMRDCELALLGHLIGDGCTLPRHVLQYTTRERDLAETVAVLATECFGDRVRPRISPERQWFQVYLPAAEHHTHGRRNAIAEWLERLGGVWGRRSWEKRLPAAVFEQSVEAVARFVRHLWSTDGCVRPNATGAPAIYYATSSESLARDLQTLLLRLDLQARVERHPQRGKGRDQYHVRLSGRSQLLGFAERVGAVGAYKTECLRQVVEQIAETHENTNRDVVPAEVWQLYVRPAMIAAGITHRQLHAAIGTAYAGMTIFRQNLGRQRALAVALATGCEALRRLAESDVYWDQVVSIVPDGEEEVFDLTVPGPHNFVADDIVVHNSIEQDADLVAFVYRDEMYNPDDPSNRGLAELIVAKHRNGETGTVELVFLGETTTFKNRAPDYLAGGPPH